MEEIVFHSTNMDCRGPGEGTSLPYRNDVLITRAFKKDGTTLFTEVSCNQLTHDRRCVFGLIHAPCPRFRFVRSTDNETDK